MSTVQDLGRPGFGHLGIGRSGAADPAGLNHANLLMGNDRGCAAIEMTLGRLRARFDSAAVLAVTGAACELLVGGARQPMNTPLTVEPGQEVRVGTPAVGLRTYLAVQGGIDVPPVLGSRSTDTLSGIGPQKLRAGSVLPFGRATGSPSGLELPPDQVCDPVLTISPGPRDDWFTPDALDILCTATWSVTMDTDRVGIRLEGPELIRSRRRELPPEPMVVGAIQVPPSGQPIIFSPTIR